MSSKHSCPLQECSANVCWSSSWCWQHSQLEQWPEQKSNRTLTCNLLSKKDLFRFRTDLLPPVSIRDRDVRHLDLVVCNLVSPQLRSVTTLNTGWFEICKFVLFLPLPVVFGFIHSQSLFCIAFAFSSLASTCLCMSLDRSFLPRAKWKLEN